MPALPALRRLPFFLLLLTMPLSPAYAQEQVDEAAIAAIREQGMEKSRLKETLWRLTDVYGPRLTGSPNLQEASEWAVSQLKEWGLENVHLAPWGPFGRGWTLRSSSLNVASPNPFVVPAYPKAWSPGVNGIIQGEVVIFRVESEEDFSKYRGKLKGKVVLLEAPRSVADPFVAAAKRYDAQGLLDLANAGSAEAEEKRYSPDAIRRLRLLQESVRFLYEESPLLLLDHAYTRGDFGTIFVSAASVPYISDGASSRQAYPWQLNAAVIPQFTLSAEYYNRIYRLVDRGIPVVIEAEIDAVYHDLDLMAYNVIGEIPGTDPLLGDEVVMFGAHLDSWHGGTGATDNAAGSAVMMEVARILQELFKATGKQPRRTIRIALWSGEEQGLLGSWNYVNDHFAQLPDWTQPPVAFKAEYDKLSAYYNLDNGAGRIRGVYLQENEAVRPIFRAWLAPFEKAGAATLSYSRTGSTDHVPFDRAGLPGFQFIQDPVSYSRTHHSTLDVFDHVMEEDLKQAATIIAAFVYHTAQREERLPRKPLIMPAEPAQAGSH